MTKRSKNTTVADVCIVGAGPAGMTIALAIGEAGRAVTVLESGGLRSLKQAQELNDGDHRGEPYLGLVRTRHRQIGGTANIWNVWVHGELGAKYVPLSRRDLADWPLEWEDLEPHYIEAQELCGLGPFEYGADYWTTPTRRPFALDGTHLTSNIYQFGFGRRFTVDLPNRLQRSAAVTVMPSTTVVGLTWDEGTHRVLGVRVIDGHGRGDEITARAVVLACGAVENARLLLLSGLGETSPWLGRGFMEHARDFSLALVPSTPGPIGEAAFYDLHESHGGVLVGGRLALTEEAQENEQLPSASMTLFPRLGGRKRTLGARMLRLLRRAAGIDQPGMYGWSRTTSSAEAFRIILNLEQRPLEANRIELGSRLDRFGNPLPRLVLHWTDEDQARLEHLREAVAASFRAAGIGRLDFTKGVRPDLSAHHHAGTTRMGEGPRDGVVDRDGRVFPTQNLFVAGASAFPTAGFANPTLTIVAMALRLARHVDSLLG